MNKTITVSDNLGVLKFRMKCTAFNTTDEVEIRVDY